MIFDVRVLKRGTEVYFKPEFSKQYYKGNIVHFIHGLYKVKCNGENYLVQQFEVIEIENLFTQLHETKKPR